MNQKKRVVNFFSHFQNRQSTFRSSFIARLQKICCSFWKYEIPRCPSVELFSHKLVPESSDSLLLPRTHPFNHVGPIRERGKDAASIRCRMGTAEHPTIPTSSNSGSPPLLLHHSLHSSPRPDTPPLPPEHNLLASDRSLRRLDDLWLELPEDGRLSKWMVPETTDPFVVRQILPRSNAHDFGDARGTQLFDWIPSSWDHIDGRFYQLCNEWNWNSRHFATYQIPSVHTGRSILDTMEKRVGIAPWNDRLQSWEYQTCFGAWREGKGCCVGGRWSWRGSRCSSRMSYSDFEEEEGIREDCSADWSSTCSMLFVWGKRHLQPSRQPEGIFNQTIPDDYEEDSGILTTGILWKRCFQLHVRSSSIQKADQHGPRSSNSSYKNSKSDPRANRHSPRDIYEQSPGSFRGAQVQIWHFSKHSARHQLITFFLSCSIPACQIFRYSIFQSDFHISIRVSPLTYWC